MPVNVEIEFDASGDRKAYLIRGGDKGEPLSSAEEVVEVLDRVAPNLPPTRRSQIISPTVDFFAL